MKSCFRSEVFNICKRVQQSSKFSDIKNILHKTSYGYSNEEVEISGKLMCPNIIYYGNQMKHQFYGFLYLDDELYSSDTSIKLKVGHLTDVERILLERGHKTLNRFVELCTCDIKEKSKIVGDALDPYFLYKKVKCNDQVKPLLTDEELQLAVMAFKKGQNYKALYEADMNTLYNKIDCSTMRVLVKNLEEQITKSYNGNVTEYLTHLSRVMINGGYNQDEELAIFTMLICALRDSLTLACQMIYLSMYGGDMSVLNNDNIINIEERERNFVCERAKVLIQDFGADMEGNRPGNIILIDCDPPKEEHIHKFGMINSVTMSLCGDSGNTTKYSVVILNDELNSINEFTENILNFHCME